MFSVHGSYKHRYYTGPADRKPKVGDKVWLRHGWIDAAPLDATLTKINANGTADLMTDDGETTITSAPYDATGGMPDSFRFKADVDAPAV